MDALLSHLSTWPASYFIYSSFSFYAPRRGGELPGTWLVAALSTVGIPLATTRQTLYRLERAGDLAARIAGRGKYYRLTPMAQAEVGAGTEKIFGSPPTRWDGTWSIVTMRFATEDRAERDRVRDVLQSEGYGAIAQGVFVHPRDRTARILDAARAAGLQSKLAVFTGARLAPAGPLDIPALWDLDALAGRYRAFVRKYSPVQRRVTPESPRDAFVLRFAMVLDYLDIAWRDPDLPAEVLPADSPGPRARALARTLYHRWLPGAIAWADRLDVRPVPRRARALTS